MQPVNNKNMFQLFEETPKVGNKTLPDQTAMFDTICTHTKSSEAKHKFLLKNPKTFFQKMGTAMFDTICTHIKPSEVKDKFLLENPKTFFQKMGLASPPPKKKILEREVTLGVEYNSYPMIIFNNRNVKCKSNQIDRTKTNSSQELSHSQITYNTIITESFYTQIDETITPPELANNLSDR